MSIEPIGAIRPALPRLKAQPKTPGGDKNDKAAEAAGATPQDTTYNIRQTISNRSNATVVTTTVTTTVTTVESVPEPVHESTVARYSLSPGTSNPLDTRNEAQAGESAAASAPSDPGANDAQLERLIDDLAKYFHAVEADRLSRFLAKARAARSAPSIKGVQAVQAYAAQAQAPAMQSP